MRDLRRAALLLATSILPVSASATGTIPREIADHRMPSLGNTPRSLSQYLGHPVVLNIWASWCGPCARETPRLQLAYLRHLKQVVVLGVDQGESSVMVRSFAKRHHLSYPILLDRDERFGEAAGFTFPTTVFIDSNGRIQDVHRGEISAAELERRISRLH